VRTTANYDRYLEPYRAQMLDDRHAELTRALLEWCAGQCTCLARVTPHVHQVFESATFAYFCAPSDTTPDESLFLAKDTQIFFLADEGPVGELEEFRAYLEGSAAAGRGELTAWYVTLLSEMRAAGLRTTDYNTATRDMCAAIAQERGVNPHQLQAAQYLALRRRSIAGGPYTACWIALRHRHLDDHAARLWAELDLLGLANEAVLLTNDLGSLEQDLRPRSLNQPASLNYALIKHPGLTTLDTRIEATIDLANRRAAQIQHRFALVEEAAALHEPRLIEFASFVASLVNGNLDATLHLIRRYPAASKRLGRLRRLDPEFAPRPHSPR
jgi:Terpene synthase family 2, C-terminal metal binding